RRPLDAREPHDHVAPEPEKRIVRSERRDAFQLQVGPLGELILEQRTRQRYVNRQLVGVHLLHAESMPSNRERQRPDGRLSREHLERLDELLAELVVDQRALLGELCRRVADGYLGLDDSGAGRGEHLAQLSLSPHGAERTGAGADDERGLPAENRRRNRPREQSTAFFSWPGTDALYSGVAKRIASAPATASRKDE